MVIFKTKDLTTSPVHHLESKALNKHNTIVIYGLNEGEQQTRIKSYKANPIENLK